VVGDQIGVADQVSYWDAADLGILPAAARPVREIGTLSVAIAPRSSTGSTKSMRKKVDARRANIAEDSTKTRYVGGAFVDVKVDAYVDASSKPR